MAGILAAAGIYALENNVERLDLDHEHATLLKTGLGDIEDLEISTDSGQTNMVFISTRGKGPELELFMKKRGILISGEDNMRLVTHLDISSDDIKRVIDAFKDFFA